MTELVVRALDPELDFEAFRAMRLQAVEQHPEAFSSPLAVEQGRGVEEWKTRWLGQGTHNRRALGGYVDGVLSGILTIFPYPKDETGTSAYIASLYIVPAARGTGLVDKMYDAFKAFAATVPEWTCVRLGHYVSNPRSVAVSVRNGFTLYESTTEVNSNGVESVLERYVYNIPRSA